jgi:hypothetical protein
MSNSGPKQFLVGIFFQYQDALLNTAQAIFNTAIVNSINETLRCAMVNSLTSQGTAMEREPFNDAQEWAWSCRLGDW